MFEKQIFWPLSAFKENENEERTNCYSAFYVEPSLSIKRVEAQLGILRNTVWTTLTENGRHPFYVKKCNASSSRFYTKIIFCDWL